MKVKLKLSQLHLIKIPTRAFARTYMYIASNKLAAYQRTILMNKITMETNQSCSMNFFVWHLVPDVGLHSAIYTTRFLLRLFTLISLKNRGTITVRVRKFTCRTRWVYQATVPIELERKVFTRILVIRLHAVQVLMRFTEFNSHLSVTIVMGKLGNIVCSMMFVQNQTLSPQIICITGGYIEK